MTPEEELGPPPQPKKTNFKPPPMPEHMKGGGGGGGGGAPPPPVAGGPMMMAAPNGHPMVGGMGPNLVFNFYNPGMGMMCQQPQAEEKKPDGPPPPPIRVQGGPTWCQPRVTVGVGRPVKKEPCCIM